jgi:hypothetical protein
LQEVVILKELIDISSVYAGTDFYDSAGPGSDWLFYAASRIPSLADHAVGTLIVVIYASPVNASPHSYA